ncbi:A24 family peptidase [Paenibacillus roseipurpureus]|uniref:A24 family peptidase n=1 Tax=Paenibacillus roseopurpureus TaxID=2918901 RepID=A0AA96LLZ4_9BACL|nr:A24 family peptidase [Paenibacillus sp. MBLB1832]WNR42249.1 A24 family peptidase [Paenibacillus sp. MBLB1832]
MIPITFITYILIAFVIDIRHAKLPNKLTMCGTLIGLMFHSVTQGWTGFLFACMGALAGFFVVLLLHIIGALGAGDVKLFAAIGAMMGVSFALQTLMYAVLCAGLIGLFLLFIRKRLRATSHRLTNWILAIVALQKLETLLEIKHQKNMKFPFMYAVLPGVACAWVYSF